MVCLTAYLMACILWALPGNATCMLRNWSQEVSANTGAMRPHVHKLWMAGPASEHDWTNQPTNWLTRTLIPVQQNVVLTTHPILYSSPPKPQTPNPKPQTFSGRPAVQFRRHHHPQPQPGILPRLLHPPQSRQCCACAHHHLAGGGAELVLDHRDQPTIVSGFEKDEKKRVLVVRGVWMVFGMDQHVNTLNGIG